MHLLLCVLSTIASVGFSLSVTHRARSPTGNHIVSLKREVPRSDVLKLVNLSNNHISSEFDIINGFAGHFDDNTLTILQSHPDVISIHEDGWLRVTSAVNQTDAPWGLARVAAKSRILSRPDTALNFTYTYDSTAGACSDIYLIDTGINTGHVDFGGRARYGTTFAGTTPNDDHGHGTHCAGTAAGTRFGVAKGAILYAVKVVNDTGLASTTNVLNGLNYALLRARYSTRPSVVSLPIEYSTALDSAINALTDAGVHVVTANVYGDIERAPSASITAASSTIFVDPSDINDVPFSPWTRYGALLAPGKNIISAWVGSSTATNILSGSSMATAHVAGVVAYLACLEGNLTPDRMKSRVLQYSDNNYQGPSIPERTYVAHIPLQRFEIPLCGSSTWCKSSP